MRKSTRSLVPLALAAAGLLLSAPTVMSQRANARELLASTALALPDSPRRIDITAKKFSYAPNKIDLKKGEPVVLVFHSQDVNHGFEIPELNVKVTDIKKDKDTEVAFTPTQAGQFVGKCAHYCGTGHGSMTLQVDVAE